jgi:hypothetical protein
MIFYNHDREVITEFPRSKPRCFFLMTQLGEPLPDKVIEIRNKLKAQLKKRSIEIIDAESYISGKDYLGKIWKMLFSVPCGIAIVCEKMSASTISNIFYEIGILNTLGKETIVIKTKAYKIPSDFVRTEYLVYNKNFEKKINKFLNTFFDLADHYDKMADSLELNPLLSIDYWRRAYLITGNGKYLDKAKKMFKNNDFDPQSKHFINCFLTNTSLIQMIH